MNDRENHKLDRRSFIVGAGGTVALFGLGAAKFIGNEELCRPPGGQDEGHFIGTCLRCEKCREVCPMKTVKPAGLEVGLINTRTPTMTYNTTWCDFCKTGNGSKPLCVKVCPTGALRLKEGATAENTVIGLAYLKREWCLGWQMKGCRLCYDKCPYEAMEIDEQGGISVITDKCNGCGLCENVCISLMSASIATGATERAIVIMPTKVVLNKLGAEGRRG